MTTYEIYVNAIQRKDYVLSEMEERLELMFAEGKITAEQRVELLALADDNADDLKQIDVPTKLAELEQRIAVIESAGVVVWKQGMVVNKGQTVLFNFGDGLLRYTRYDGGRASTSLSPGKISGWVILASANGVVTHTVEKDAAGNIILVPVEVVSGE